MTAIKLVIGDRLGKGSESGGRRGTASATVTIIPAWPPT